LPSFPEIRLERPHYFACNFWEANYIKCRAPHFARCARLTWITCITWLPCISSIAFIPCLICITCITWITCITFITWLSITSLNSLLIRIFKMYNLPIEANLVSWISFQPIGVKLTSWILNWRINSYRQMRKRKRSRHRGLQLWRVFVWKSWLQFVNTYQKAMESQLFFGSQWEKDILAHCPNEIWGSLTKGMTMEGIAWYLLWRR